MNVPAQSQPTGAGAGAEAGAGAGAEATTRRRLTPGKRSAEPKNYPDISDINSMFGNKGEAIVIKSNPGYIDDDPNYIPINDRPRPMVQPEAGAEAGTGRKKVHGFGV